MNERRVELIRARLESSFSPLELEIRDDSHLHAGHVGAQDGRGHFHVRIVSDVFRSTRPIDRHRMIYEALGALMKTEIHALSVSASAPAGSGATGTQTEESA